MSKSLIKPVENEGFRGAENVRDLEGLGQAGPGGKTFKKAFKNL